MKKTERKFGVLLGLLMLVSMVASGATVTIGKLKYKVDTTAKTAKCVGLATEATKNYNLTIPSTVQYNGVTLKVTTVEKDAFWFDNYLKKVTLSDYTETIGSRAFSSCDNMSVVSLGKKLKIIGKEAFAHCGNNGTFTSVTLPSTVEIIREDAFTDCRSLVSVQMGDKVESIGPYAFCNCESLKSILLPGSLKSIGEKAFAGNEELYEVTFNYGNGNTVIGPECFTNNKKLTLLNFYGPGVKEICESAFIGCHIEMLYIPSSVETIGLGAFSGNNLTLLELSEGLKTISDYAFEGQYGNGLGKLTIPSTVTTIGKKAFFGIGIPATVTCNAVTPPACGEEAFNSNVRWYSKLYVPAASVGRYAQAAVWKDFRFTNDGPTEVQEVNTDEDGEEEWYDLQGQRLEKESLGRGIYIRRRNGKTEKVVR